jgi:predicted metalloprotease with PDZ domain
MNNNSTAAKHLQINYTLSFPEAQAHYMDVEMNISGITQPFIDLKMPVWTPGSYLVREYAKHLEVLTAESGGKAISAKKINKNTWHVLTNGATAVTVKYRLYCFEVSVRTNIVTMAHAFVSSAATFLFPAGMLDNPSTIHIRPYGDWDKVTTGLDAVNDDPFTLHAPDYDSLYDSPIEVGTQDVFGFEATGVQYEVAMCMGGNYDRERLVKDLKLIAEKETAIFGENPNKRYVYIVHNYLKGAGGLEHLNSTVLGATRDGYTDEDTYQKFLGLAAHEHFHLWNVKRLRPMALGPFDYETENYTTELWIAEGFTNYYDNLVVHRMGLYPAENYLAALCVDINVTENAPGNQIQPVAEASFDAWIKFYRPNENSPNTNISYYSKGSILAMMLDLEIISNSQGRHSLDDVMKYMYAEYYHKKKRGYTADEFKLGLEQFTGGSLDDFYEKYVHGVASIDYNSYLGYAGFKLIDDLEGKNEPSLGINLINNKITSIIRGGSAWRSGLSVNDEITEIDNEPFADLNFSLANKKNDDELIVRVNRDGLLLSIKVKLLKNRLVKYRIDSIENPSYTQLQVRNIWLKQ